jgi:sulfite reductase beta subunit-like hemoprotein
MIERSNPQKDRTKYLAKSLGLDKIKKVVNQSPKFVLGLFDLLLHFI